MVAALAKLLLLGHQGFARLVNSNAIKADLAAKCKQNCVSLSRVCAPLLMTCSFAIWPEPNKSSRQKPSSPVYKRRGQYLPRTRIAGELLGTWNKTVFAPIREQVTGEQLRAANRRIMGRNTTITYRYLLYLPIALKRIRLWRLINV